MKVAPKAQKATPKQMATVGIPTDRHITMADLMQSGKKKAKASGKKKPVDDDDEDGY